MKKPYTALAILVLIIVIIAAAWYVFLKPRAAPVMNGPQGVANTTQGGMRGGFATGSIEVLNDNGFTLTLADATTKDVNLTATTTIQDYTDASSTPTTITSDQLSVGEQVQVIGSPNDDGSIDARDVRVGNFPTEMPGRGPRGATSTPQSLPAAQ